jgi:DNA-binding MarR family transcriptional regulator
MKKILDHDSAVSAGYLLFVLYWHDTFLMRKMLKSLAMPLNRVQVGVLASVLREEGSTQEAVTSEYRISKSSISRSLDGLERNGLVTRMENPENRRQKLVFPTYKAKSLAKEFVEVLKTNNELLFRGFGDQERDAAVGFLNRMIENLNSGSN